MDMVTAIKFSSKRPSAYSGMMGFYPVTPGVPVYDLTSPVFDRINLRLHNGKTFHIICRDNSKDNKYIQSIKLNGKPWNKVWISHANIVNGGRLELQMGSTPNKKLGTNPADLPPTGINLNPMTLETSRQSFP